MNLALNKVHTRTSACCGSGLNPHRKHTTFLQPVHDLELPGSFWRSFIHRGQRSGSFSDRSGFTGSLLRSLSAPRTFTTFTSVCFSEASSSRGSSGGVAVARVPADPGCPGRADGAGVVDLTELVSRGVAGDSSWSYDEIRWDAELRNDKPKPRNFPDSAPGPARPKEFSFGGLVCPAEGDDSVSSACRALGETVGPDISFGCLVWTILSGRSVLFSGFSDAAVFLSGCDDDEDVSDARRDWQVRQNHSFSCRKKNKVLY